MIRLAVLASHPIQYFAPLYREVAARPGIELTVYYCSRQGVENFIDRDFGQHVAWDVPLLEGYRHHFLPPLAGDRGVGGFWSLVNPSVVAELRRHDVVWVHGYVHATNWLAFAAAQLHGTPLLLRGESNLVPRRSLARRVLKRIGLPMLFKQVAGCLYIGTRNRAYYEHYGVPSRKLYFTPYSVDNAAFRRAAACLAPRRAELKPQFGFPPDLPVVLFVGKFTAVKRPLELLEAFARVRRDLPCGLLLVGNGPLGSVLRARVTKEGVQDVRFSGFLNQGRITEAYVAADVLVLASRNETWGLVANEAMNCELPVIVSDQVGCAGDLVRDGENGLVVPHASTEALSAAIRTLIAQPELRTAFGRRALEEVSKWGLESTTDGVVAAARAAVGK